MARSQPKQRSSDGLLSLRDRFNSVADAITRAVGTPWAMLLAALIVLAWAVTGPIFHFSDTWQLVINTGTTIVTFLMVFAIQTSQNRESTALNIKIDELIASHPNARNRLISEEIATEAEIEEDERAMMERAEAEREERGNRRRSRTSAKGSTRKSATSKRTQRGSSTSERSSARTKA
ncbi:MAG TPA: low affinity iron permease family protein [Candidatus Limnocylindria bacterium]|jgi:low affinity Fe/Cu permease|nr:low affinity iron permease family protein [Candidatus Limnocylindria bacterium]